MEGPWSLCRSALVSASISQWARPRRARHFKIQARFYRLTGGVGTAPVRHDQAFELEVLAKNLAEELGRLGSMRPVHSVVGAHLVTCLSEDLNSFFASESYKSRRVGLALGAEWLEVDFCERSLVDDAFSQTE